MAKTSHLNHIRLLLLNSDVAVPALRETFIKEVEKSSFKGNVDNFLHYFKKDFDSLNKKKIINAAAYKTLFPGNGSKTDIKEWDLSLLSFILLHCCCLEGTLQELKNVLTGEVKCSPQKDLDIYLHDNKATLDKLKNASKLTDEQYEILFPSAPWTCLEKWELDLLLCILLNLCKSSCVQKVCDKLRDIVKFFVVLSTGELNVDSFLNKNKATIDKLRKQGLITLDQYRMLFLEDHTHSDIYKWDNELLCTVILQLCSQVPKTSIHAIKNLRSFRNELIAHKGDAEIKDENFQEKRKILVDSIYILLERVDPVKKEYMHENICRLSDGPLDIESSIKVLTRWYSENKEVLSALENMKETLAEHGNILQAIQEDLRKIRELQPLEYMKQIHVFEFRAEIRISSSERDAVEKAERILTAQFRAGDSNPMRNRDTVGNAIQNLSREIQDQDTKIKKITVGSVMLHLQCDSLAALAKFTQYYTGETLSYTINKIQSLLRRELSCELEISMNIPDSDLRHLLSATGLQREHYCREERHDDEFRSSLHLLLESHSLDGMLGVWKMFISGDTTNKLNILSEALSERLGKTVTITASIKFDEFKQTLQSAVDAMKADIPGTQTSEEIDREALWKSQPQHWRSDEIGPIEAKFAQKVGPIEAKFAQKVGPIEAKFAQKGHKSRPIIAAIDIGTTYTGYAYAFTHEYEQNPSKINSYTWSDGAISGNKTPTCILFEPDGTFHSFGYEAEYKFNKLAEDCLHYDWYFFKHFKKCLYVNEKMTNDTLLEAVDGKQMKALTVFSAAISYLSDHLCQQIGCSLKMVSWTLTVPAICKDDAKWFMRNAAYNAGISNDAIAIGLEPEAGAVFCKMNTDYQSWKGMRYVLMDAGGGTVDTVVHEIQEDGRIEELFNATGGPWGGTRVDQAILTLVSNIFGKDVCDDLKKNHIEDYMEMVQTIEQEKITSDKKDTVTIRLPDQLFRIYDEHHGGSLRQTSLTRTGVNIIYNRLRVSAASFNECFKETCYMICSHLHRIFSDSNVSGVDAIIMIGGFSESKILQNAITTSFPNKKIILTDDSTSAVMKGAVMYGLFHSTRVYSRISKYTYGVGVFEEFDADIHPPAKKIKLDGKDWCKDCFDIHVTIGQEMKCQMATKVLHVPVSKQQSSIYLSLYSCNESNPRYIDTNGCRKICEVVIDIPTGLEDKDNRSVLVKMIYGYTELKFEATAVSNGLTVSDFVNI